MTRFQASGPRVRYMPVESEKPFKQIVGLYDMWQSLSPETKTRIKHAFGMTTPQEELLLEQIRAENERAQNELDRIRSGQKYENDLPQIVSDYQEADRGLAEAGAMANKTLDMLKSKKMVPSKIDWYNLMASIPTMEESAANNPFAGGV